MVISLTSDPQHQINPIPEQLLPILKKKLG